MSTGEVLLKLRPPVGCAAWRDVSAPAFTLPVDAFFVPSDAKAKRVDDRRRPA